MKKILLILLLFQFENVLIAQTDKLEDLCQIFNLSNKNDTTTFVVFGTKSDIKIKKPVFFFRQGSLPEPLLELYKGKYYLRLPFDLKPYREKYHFVIAQKIGTRLLVDSTYLAEYETSKRTFNEKFYTKKYLENNNLQAASLQCNRIINYLVKQSWVDTRKVVYCGGSEGFTIGANVVANNKNITQAILFSGHAGRRFESEIFNIRKQINAGELKADEGQKQIEWLYTVWEDICKYPKDIDKNYGDSYATWFSFSTKNSDNLLKINIPLYIAYGTDDNEIAASMDYLPLDFIAKGKKNLTLRAYINHDHQFFESIKDENGKEKEKIYRGDEVAKDWMDWLSKN